VLCTLLLVSCWAVACSGLPTVHFNNPFGRSDWVELSDASVTTGAAPALNVTITNRVADPIWIRMMIDEVEGRNDCANNFRLGPEQSHRYVCPQAFVNAGKRYVAELTVFRDRGNTQVAELIRRHVELLRNDAGELILLGRPAD